MILTDQQTSAAGNVSYLLGTKIDHTSYAKAVETVLGWAQRREPRYAIFANVHVVMEAYDSESYRTCINSADLVAPDGMPLVWALKFSGLDSATRVYGPDFTIYSLEAAAREGVPVGFLGGRPEVLAELTAKALKRFPGLQIVYSFAPPFRPLTDAEETQILNDVVDSGARLLYIGLGCPKQEIWMHKHAGKVPVVMLGVGAAFDFIAESVKQAPRWMMASGLEWTYRLYREPKRLWRRYFKHNPRFVFLTLASKWTDVNPSRVA